MALDPIILEWESEFRGVLSTPRGQILVGDQENGIYPYHMLFGALGSCFYSTFLTIATKKKCTFDSAKVEVSGHKKNGEPGEVTLLEHVLLKLIIKNPSDKIQLEKSAELGAKFCSIHKTIEQVAHIELVVEFV